MYMLYNHLYILFNDKLVGRLGGEYNESSKENRVHLFLSEVARNAPLLYARF